MLKQLSIKNFALIQEANLNFSKGYTVITGETGSGKSILLNALHLLLGERADYKVIGLQGDKAIVEAIVDLSNKQLLPFFQNNDLDFEEETIIRREITKQGKSRAFVNDVPVQLVTLKALTEQLISIHSQYNTLDLKRKEYQIEVLDILANTKDLQLSFTRQFDEFKSLAKEITLKKEQLFQLEKEKDYAIFQLNELEEVQLTTTDFKRIEEQLKQVENGTEITQLKSIISTTLSEENGVITALQQLKNQVVKLAKIDSSTQELEQRIQSVIIELKDVDNELNNASSFEYELSEEKIHQLTELVDKYNRLLVKHRCTTQEELIEIQHKFKNETDSTDQLQQLIVELETKLRLIETKLATAATELHTKRQNTAPLIEKTIMEKLTELKLPETKLEFKLAKKEQFNNFGFTELQLLFSANKGIPTVEIDKAASGGELSRVMLALQQFISEKTNLPTIFFDEIDTGVSGDVAQKMGILLQKMGQNIQLFAISHLPQVAAKASGHFKVEKQVTKEGTHTLITNLNHEERIHEIARLMSGEQINEAAISNAKALMV